MVDAIARVARKNKLLLLSTFTLKHERNAKTNTYRRSWWRQWDNRKSCGETNFVHKTPPPVSLGYPQQPLKTFLTWHRKRPRKWKYRNSQCNFGFSLTLPEATGFSKPLVSNWDLRWGPMRCEAIWYLPPNNEWAGCFAGIRGIACNQKPEKYIWHSLCVIPCTVLLLQFSSTFKWNVTAVSHPVAIFVTD